VLVCVAGHAGARRVRRTTLVPCRVLLVAFGTRPDFAVDVLVRPMALRAVARPVDSDRERVPLPFGMAPDAILRGRYSGHDPGDPAVRK